MFLLITRNSKFQLVDINVVIMKTVEVNIQFAFYTFFAVNLTFYHRLIQMHLLKSHVVSRKIHIDPWARDIAV